MQPIRATLATPPMPGAVAIIDLTGENVATLLTQITAISTWQPGVVRLANFADIDQGLAVLIDEHHAQLMPHAGPRVVQRLMVKLIELGAEAFAGSDGAFGEGSHIASGVSSQLWRAASPAAIDLLLAQPRLWREWLDANREPSDEAIQQIISDSAKLDRLLTPPNVVVVGSPNVGKSTLSNTILGRDASIVADMPGTTRDFVSSPIEIDGVALRWLDTPGLRITADSVESEAIGLAWNVLEKADILIGMRDAEHGWPDASNLPRKPDLHVITKCDRGANSLPADRPDVIRLSAHTGAGIDELTQKVLAKLGLSRADRTPRPWAFSVQLRNILIDRDWKFLRRYVRHDLLIREANSIRLSDD